MPDRTPIHQLPVRRSFIQPTQINRDHLAQVMRAREVLEMDEWVRLVRKAT